MAGLLWTPELECALERFSISKYLDCCDDCDEDERVWVWAPSLIFTDVFLNYLEQRVSNPIKYQLQLLILIRENLTFITTIPSVIWNMPHLPSTIPPVERNSPSCGLFGLSFRNPSHRYRGVLRLQGGMDYALLYLGSTSKRSIGIGKSTSSCVTQPNIHLTKNGHGAEHRNSQSLSSLIGLPVSRFHVCNTYIVRTPILLRRRTNLSDGQ